MNVSKDEDEDLHNYLKNLRDTLVVCYTTIVHGVNEQNTKQYLAQYTPNIFLYLSQIMSKEFSPNLVNSQY